MLRISLSWDDGAKEDLKIINLSHKYGIPGMFFIPAKNPERRVIQNDLIRIINDSGFETGAHTYSHVYLTSIKHEAACEEIRAGKYFLENLLCKEIPHFCFPGGKYNEDLIIEAKKYFISARTADTCSLVVPGSFLIKPSFHFYDRGVLSLIINGCRHNLEIFKSIIQSINTADYFNILKNCLKLLSQSKDEYRIIIWGHSWEIEKFGLWKKLEDFFIFLKGDDQFCLEKYSDIVRTK